MDLKPPEVHLWLTLDRVYTILSRRIAGKLAEVGLTSPQYRVLRLLSDHGPLSPNTLAERLGVTPGNLTGILDRLESAGHLHRTREAGDRRSVRVQITPQGTDLMRVAVPDVRDHVRTLFSTLTPEELQHTQALLERLEHHLSPTEVTA
ncbi:MarR family winged helix-turn-helix transcriptional regulator [Deinococcus maricopensis]|uniref:Transcriptional regulator, MarR family n=1 Tax=Deinococcus maricopensis (strain DSM 21211 / LMG 22137 / NRRL B-23946 / LB-34) TaxID=709986 RepID=E8U676_DEIML|nr:MarR family transcriptional regulator [Deinococcus maricopensis]ADV66565.1 transcriptional regulator, MarR family [Deinococcus maricopensis DSM 21211]